MYIYTIQCIYIPVFLHVILLFYKITIKIQYTGIVNIPKITMQFIINFCETRNIKTSILTEWNTYILWVHLYIYL